jgi:succinoglycan biosynthesis protein ExoM
MHDAEMATELDAISSAVSREGDHISVCVCTFRRPLLLKRLLLGLEGQVTDGTFTYSIVVVDNDGQRSAQGCVTEFAARSRVTTTYAVESQQNIALARNEALRHAKGGFVAFIDDDEFPRPDWLLLLVRACERFGADVVLGPVRPHFEEQPPQWIIRGRFCERPEYETGRIVKWDEGRTGNILFRTRVLGGSRQAFDAKFGDGGEDKDFLKRVAEGGAVLVWCNEAVVHESVPRARWKRSYMVRRALLRGRNILKHPTGRLKLVVTSTVAVPLYLLALPGAFLAGQHVFMKCCIKLCDHLGRLLALVGMNPVRTRDS